MRARRKKEREKHGHPTETPSVQKCLNLPDDVGGCAQSTIQLYIYKITTKYVNIAYSKYILYDFLGLQR